MSQTSLLGLLVQLHVRHQDVLLGLLRQAGIGAAVASAFIRPPGPHSPPTVQVDDRDDQRHQEQRRHRDDDERGQMVAVGWVGRDKRTQTGGCDSGGDCPGLKEHTHEAVVNLLATTGVSATAGEEEAV